MVFEGRDDTFDPAAALLLTGLYLTPASSFYIIAA